MDILKPYVITIVGPESSGKTTLARELASFYGCPWVPEYAREYLEGIARPYGQADLVAIAEGQWAGISRQLAVVSQQSPANAFQFDDGIRGTTSLGAEALKVDFGVHALTFELEDIMEKERPLLIVDSGMLSVRMWAKLKYDITIPYVEDSLAKDVTSMYILCRPNFPWTPDPLREAPSLLERAWIYNQYLKEVSAIPRK